MAALTKKLFFNNQTAEAPTLSGVIPLSMVSPGNKVCIQSFRGKDEMRRFLETLGFVEQAEVTVITKLGGNLIVQIKESRIAISKSTAGRIYTA